MRMMRVVVLALLMTGGYIILKGSEDVEAGVLEVNKELDLAYLEEDVGRLREILSEDHVHNNCFGMKMGCAVFLGDIESGELRFEAYESEVPEVKVLAPSVCLVTGFLNAEAWRGGKQVKGRFLYTRVYVKESGNWRVKHFQNTRVGGIARGV